MSKTYLNFDLGTTKIKSALINENGNFIYTSKRIAKTYYEGEAVFQKPGDYYNVVVDEIRKIKKVSPSQFKNVDSLICSGQMGGILGIDRNWKTVFPWTYSVDTRANRYLLEIEKKLSCKIRESSGGIPLVAAQIKWIKEEFPNDYKKIDKFINLTTYVAGKLCNLKPDSAFIDYSVLAMNGLADIKNGNWNRDICNILGIDLNKLPVIKKPYEVVGYINKELFKTRDDIKVLVGIGDQIAGFIGAGVVNKNDLVNVVGTYTVVGCCTDKFFPDADEKIISSIYSGIEDIYYQFAVVTVGGYLYNWFKENFKYDDSKAIKGKIDTDGLYFVPHIGGRLVPSQPYYEGTWFGIKWHHNLDSFYISLLESIGYESDFLLEKIKEKNRLDSKYLNEIKVIGGGSKNKTWNKIKASILNLKHKVMKNVSFEILGNFLIAKYGKDIKSGVKDLIKNRVISVVDEINPDEKETEYYKFHKKRYIEIVDKIGNIYKEFS